LSPFRPKLVSVLFFFLGPLALGAQEDRPNPPAGAEDALTVSLVTIGQGDLVWERFGHNALLFQNEETGTEVVYHWGIFNFFSEDFVPRLIRGTMLYSMGPSDFRDALAEYRGAGRPVWIQELALSPYQERELLALVEENYLPQNRDYRYDYYRDNCSTRLRDALDHILDGNMEARFASDTTEHSFRWHTRRILREMPPYYLGIQFVLGPSADRPITLWEQMFLPRTLMESIREVRISDGAGGSRALVIEEEEILGSGRSAAPTSPPFALPIFLVIGVLWGGGLLWLAGSRTHLGVWRRMGILVLGGGWSLVAGLGGTLLLGAWLYTDHEFWYANFNLFQVNPLFFLLSLAFVISLLRNGFPVWGRNLAVVLGAVSVLGLVVEMVPGLGQDNAEILALTLPINLGLWAAAVGLHRRGRDGPISTDEPSG
jgi:hypothetical protein